MVERTSHKSAAVVALDMLVHRRKRPNQAIQHVLVLIHHVPPERHSVRGRQRQITQVILMVTGVESEQDPVEEMDHAARIEHATQGGVRPQQLPAGNLKCGPGLPTGIVVGRVTAVVAEGDGVRERHRREG